MAADSSRRVPPKAPAIGRAAATPFGHRPLRTFALVMGLPAFLLYVASVVLVIFVLSMMASEINRLDDARATQAMSASSTSFLQTLADATADEGTWNEAYINAVVGNDPGWLDSTWGSTARIGDSYDNVMVTDYAGTIVFGENRIGSIDGNIVGHFSTAASMLDELDQAISDQGDAAVISHFSTDETGVAGLAAISIHRSTPGDMTIPRANRRILWLARHLVPGVLQDIAANFQVPVPELQANPDPDRLSVPLVEVNGAVATSLTWVPDRPGNAAFNHALLVATAVLFIIGLLLALGLGALRRTLLRRAGGVANALAEARLDPLTGMMNQHGLLDALASLLEGVAAPKPAAVALLGIDEFEILRDVHGPEVAEQLMRLVGKAIAGAIGGEGLLARVSEGSFAIGAAGDKAAETVKRLAASASAAASAPVEVDGVTFEPKLSIGVGTGDNAEPSAQLQTARAALHAARKSGVRDPVTYDIAEESDRKRDAEMARHLRNAISTDEIDVEYQPIFDLRAQTMVGVEALLRWKRAGGTVSAAQFMPVAAASGLVDELGLLALRRAARDILPLKGLMLAVNVATSQFDNPLFPEQLRATLAGCNFPMRRLQIEIDQSLLAGKPHRATAFIDDMRAAGIVVALDDFVVGQSSIGYLRQFNLDRVKLAKSLVSGIDSDKTKLALVETTINIAKSAGAAITATGVERKEEAGRLLKLGCTEFQGYLFARPMTLESLIKLILSSGQEPAKKAG